MKTAGSSEQIVSDFAITLDILGAFKTNPQIPFNDIEVITKNGCVTLRGNIKYKYQKEITRSLVKNVQGVRKLENNIAVKSKAKDTLFCSYSAN